MTQWWITATLTTLTTLTTGGCTDPGIEKNDCPGTPKIISLAQTGPFWSGLERITFTVPGGDPDSFQVQTFNPALGTWTGFPSSFLEQKDDGSYVVSSSVTPSEDTKDASFKLRVRALLSSCPASDWATTEAFTVGDPVADTVWKAHVDAGSFFSFVQPNLALGVGTTVGPYALSAAGVDHTMQFHASGALDEIWAFGIDSKHAGDLYAGCKFSVHLVGQWHWTFQPFFRLSVSGLTPAASPLAGSTCANPALADMAINQPGFVANIQSSQLFPSIDYTLLLHATPGKVIWSENQEIDLLAQVFSGLSDFVGADQASLQGNTSFNNVSYEKQ
jgi:hypothetical protein